MQVIEGTWEEIAAHAAEFNGHRLRVIDLGMIAASPADDYKGPTLDELFGGKPRSSLFTPGPKTAPAESDSEHVVADTPVPSDEFPLLEIAYNYPVNPDSPRDGAAQHDHYLYGMPKMPEKFSQDAILDTPFSRN